MQINLEITGVEGMQRRLEILLKELGDPTELNRIMDKLMGETLEDVQARTPSMPAEEEAQRPEKKIGLGEKWRFTKPDKKTWVIEHEFSEPSHPHYVILASIERGSEPHVIMPVTKSVLTWPDSALAAILRMKYGHRAWVTSDDWVLFGEVAHPGTRPYNMLKDATEALRNKLPGAMAEWRREVTR